MDIPVSKLTEKYRTEDIECACVQFFVERNSIPVKRNRLVKSILSRRNAAVEKVKDSLARTEDKFDIFQLVKIFELLIPKKDRKTNGAFFTPAQITDFIAGEAIGTPRVSVCDPSCGCGAFLIAAAYALRKRKKKIISTIEKNLYGVDIADYSVRRSKILLTLLALQENEDKQEIKFNIHVADSLATDWGTLFPGILKRGGFDVVIGNPPYVKFQELSNKLRESLPLNWETLNKGNYNLYFAFFELGVKILKNDGVLGYITPNNYFTSISGIRLREFLTETELLDRVIDFNHLKIFDAQTYTCITFLKKHKKQFFYYERVGTIDQLNNLKSLDYSKIYFSKLNKIKWRLLRSEDQDNIKKIEGQANKLGNLVNIRVGIATCKDSVYFVDGNNYKNGYYFKVHKKKTFYIETEVVRTISKISDFVSQKDLDNNKRRIIFPYKIIGNKAEIIPEEEFASKYPMCYEYLLEQKEVLATRDKGKVKYPVWYAYARTQGLNFKGCKLLTPTFSSEPRFLYDHSADSLFCNGYAIFLKENQASLFSEGLDLNILSKILNSRIMNYYVSKTSVSIEGDFPCYQKNFIELFGVPDFTDEELAFLRKERNKEKIEEFLIKKYHIRI